MAQVRSALWFGSSAAYTVDAAQLPVSPQVGDVLLWIGVNTAEAPPAGWTTRLSVTPPINSRLDVASLPVSALPIATFSRAAASSGVLICLTGVDHGNLVDFTFSESSTAAAHIFIDPASNPSTTQNNVLVFEIATARGASTVEADNEMGNGLPLCNQHSSANFGPTGQTLSVREKFADTAGPFDIARHGYYITSAPASNPKIIAAIGIRSASGYAPRRVSGGYLTGPDALVGVAHSFASGASWSNLSTRRSTIGSRSVVTTAPFAINDVGVTPRRGQFLRFQWNFGSVLSNVSFGVVTNIPASDFSGFQTVDFNHNTADAGATPVSHGLYYEDANGNWAALVGGSRVEADLVAQYTASPTLFFRPQDLTVVDSGGTIDYTAITWIGFWQDAQARQTRDLAFRQWHRIVPLVLAGGSDAIPLTFEDLNIATGGGVLRPIDTRKYTDRGGITLGSQFQFLNRLPVTIGNGTSRTVFRSAGFSVEVPTGQYYYRPIDGSGNILFNASAACDISFANGLFVTQRRNTHGPAVGCSTTATIRHTNSTWRGWQITWRDGVECVGAAFTRCLISGAAGKFRNCIVTESDETTAAMTLAAGGEARSCSFTRRNETYALSLQTAGAYDLTGTTFSGYTTPIRVAATTGTVTITLGQADAVPAVDSAGATVVFSKPQSVYTVTGIVSGSRLLIRRTDTQAVLVNETVAGTSRAYSYTHTADVPVEIVLRKATGSPAYQEWRTTATLTSAGGAVTANQVSDE